MFVVFTCGVDTSYKNRFYEMRIVAYPRLGDSLHLLIYIQTKQRGQCIHSQITTWNENEREKSNFKMYIVIVKWIKDNTYTSN